MSSESVERRNVKIGLTRKHARKLINDAETNTFQEEMTITLRADPELIREEVLKTFPELENRV